MKFTLATIAANLVALVCASSAVYMAINSIEGWGWFLFIALLATGSVSMNSEEE